MTYLKISKTFIMCLFILLNKHVLAEGRPENTAAANTSQESHFVNSLKIGALFSSKYEYRGVIFYNDFQLTPVIRINMWDNSIEYQTNSISYRKFIYNDNLRFRTRLISIDDNPLFPKHESITKIYPDREGTFEWLNRLELFVPGYNENYAAEISLGIAKDLKAHKGYYSELMTKVKAFDFRFRPIKNTLIEPNMFLAVGAGDKKHNEYFYGAKDSSGLNNIAYGVWVNFPELADRNNSIIQIRRFEVLGDKNKNGLYAKNRSSGWAITFVGTVNLL